MALSWINKELRDLEVSPIQNMSAGPTGDDMHKWTATMFGP